MIKILQALSLVVFLQLNAACQDLMTQRQNLQSLIEQRAQNFSAYAGSIQKRSGIFGNKTRRDLEKSNEILMQIVTTDNNIIDAMNRILEFRTFEKTSKGYDTRKFESKLQQSMEVTDTLTKQIIFLESRNKILESRNTKLKGLVVLLFAVVGGIGIAWWKRKN